MLFIPVYWFVPIATLYLCCHLFSFWLNVFQWKEFTFLPPTDHWIISLFIADTVVPAGKERQIPRLWSDCSLFSFCLWSLIYLPLVFNTRMHEWTGRHLNFICYVQCTLQPVSGASAVQDFQFSFRSSVFYPLETISLVPKTLSAIPEEYATEAPFSSWNAETVTQFSHVLLFSGVMWIKVLLLSGVMWIKKILV